MKLKEPTAATELNGAAGRHETGVTDHSATAHAPAVTTPPTNPSAIWRILTRGESKPSSAKEPSSNRRKPQFKINARAASATAETAALKYPSLPRKALRR